MFMIKVHKSMFSASRPAPAQLRRQKGFTLTELLIASAISLVAVAGMIVVMSSTLGSTTQVINATRLSGDIRAAMQVVGRDLRRANYSPTFNTCIGSGAAPCAAVPETVVFEPNNNCVAYGYTRNDGTVISGAMRLGGGALQFRTDARSCADSSNWRDLTDPQRVTITNITLTGVDGNDLTYETAATSALTQRVRKLRVSVTGQACPVGATCTGAPVRTVATTVRVRNDIVFPTPAS